MLNASSVIYDADGGFLEMKLTGPGRFQATQIDPDHDRVFVTVECLYGFKVALPDDPGFGQRPYPAHRGGTPRSVGSRGRRTAVSGAHAKSFTSGRILRAGMGNSIGTTILLP